MLATTLIKGEPLACQSSEPEAAIIASTIAFQRGNVAVVAAILGFAPAATIAIAWRFDGEQVRRWQWLGVGLAIATISLFAVAA
ncbi:MAG: hypothetical protein EBY61_01660 [Actinobacteria bacterium]|nr:hypothetical protein [Actinomycetota bacterium]